MNEFIAPKTLPVITPHMEMLIKQEAIEYVFANNPRDTSVDAEPLIQAASLYDYLIGFECPQDEESVYDVIERDLGIELTPWERYEDEDLENIISIMIEKRAQLDTFAKEIISAHIGNY